jgi:leucyl-tRNA synthetase
VHQQPWPTWDRARVRARNITLIVQVDGRVRDRLSVPADIDEQTAREQALDSPGVRRSLDGRAAARVVYVPGRLVNVVTEG